MSVSVITLELQKLWNPGGERCGVINPAGEIIERKNLAEDPSDQFRFAPEDLEGAPATWHTHPSSGSNLSIADYWFFMQWSEMLHFVVSADHVQCYVVVDGTVRIIDETSDHPPWLLEEAPPGGSDS